MPQFSIQHDDGSFEDVDEQRFNAYKQEAMDIAKQKMHDAVDRIGGRPYVIMGVVRGATPHHLDAEVLIDVGVATEDVHDIATLVIAAREFEKTFMEHAAEYMPEDDMEHLIGDLEED